MFLKFKNTILNMEKTAFIKKENKFYYLTYRKKASIKEIEIPIKFNEIEDTSFFMKHNFFKLEKYFINIDMISFVNTTELKDNYIKAHFFFLNGLELELVLEKGRYTIWCDNRLR